MIGRNINTCAFQLSVLEKEPGLAQKWQQNLILTGEELTGALTKALKDLDELSRLSNIVYAKIIGQNSLDSRAVS